MSLFVSTNHNQHQLIMSFCYKCGKELTPGKPFCKHCGARVAPPIVTSNCANCGTPAKPGEKYCNVCGYSLSGTPPQPAAAISQPSNPNTGNTTAPASGPNSPGNHLQMPYAASQEPKKKKRNCLGCFFKSLIAVILLVVAGILSIYFFTDWLDDTTKELKSPVIESQVDGSDAAIENQIALDKADAKNLDEAINLTEEAFANADTNQLKNVLTGSSAIKYERVYREIQPYMKEYARSFKNRKPEKSNSFYALYSFTDETGKKYTAEFALTGDGTWKLVRF